MLKITATPNQDFLPDAKTRCKGEFVREDLICMTQCSSVWSSSVFYNHLIFFKVVPYVEKYCVISWHAGTQLDSPHPFHSRHSFPLPSPVSQFSDLLILSCLCLCIALFCRWKPSRPQLAHFFQVLLQHCLHCKIFPKSQKRISRSLLWSQFKRAPSSTSVVPTCWKFLREVLLVG